MCVANNNKMIFCGRQKQYLGAYYGIKFQLKMMMKMMMTMVIILMLDDDNVQKSSTTMTFWSKYTPIQIISLGEKGPNQPRRAQYVIAV